MTEQLMGSQNINKAYRQTEHFNATQ